MTPISEGFGLREVFTEDSPFVERLFLFAFDSHPSANHP